jgi:hypothetical protein
MSAYGDPHGDVRERSYRERMRTLKARLLRILEQLQADERLTDVFQKLVTNAIAPGYLTTTPKPMDFQTIEKRFARFSDYYKRPEMFWVDIQQMVDNCKQFTSSKTIYYKAAVNLWTKFRALEAAEFPDGAIDH